MGRFATRFGPGGPRDGIDQEKHGRLETDDVDIKTPLRLLLSTRRDSIFTTTVLWPTAHSSDSVDIVV